MLKILPEPDFFSFSVLFLYSLLIIHASLSCAATSLLVRPWNPFPYTFFALCMIQNHNGISNFDFKIVKASSTSKFFILFYMSWFYCHVHSFIKSAFLKLRIFFFNLYLSSHNLWSPAPGSSTVKPLVAYSWIIKTLYFWWQFERGIHWVPHPRMSGPSYKQHLLSKLLACNINTT